MPLANVRIEPYVVAIAAPLVAHAVDQIAHGVDLVGGESWNLDVSVLHVMRIEIDDREHDIRSVRRVLAVGDDLRVVGRVKPQREVELQGAVRTADLVDAADQLLDVSRPVPVPGPA